MSGAGVEVIRGLPFSEYLKIDAVNGSSLWHIEPTHGGSPLLYRHMKNLPDTDSPAKAFGRAVHKCVLEPDRFPLEYAMWDGTPRNTKAGKEKWANVILANPGKEIISESDYLRAIAIRDAVRSHGEAGMLLHEKGDAEITILWTHLSTGLRMKARIDWLCSETVDLKTARTIKPGRFDSDAAGFGYHFKAAGYSDAVAAAFGPRPYALIVVESAPPHDVTVLDVDSDLIAAGSLLYEQALGKLAECLATGVWPGSATTGRRALTLPAWATPQEEPIDYGTEIIC